jgi:hypothetical protein
MDNEQLPAYPVSVTREWREGNNGVMYEIKEDYEGMSKLEAFTMAAMQGLCSGVNICELTANEVVSIAYSAADIAERTLIRLSELQKQQS